MDFVFYVLLHVNKAIVVAMVRLTYCLGSGIFTKRGDIHLVTSRSTSGPSAMQDNNLGGPLQPPRNTLTPWLYIQKPVVNLYVYIGSGSVSPCLLHVLYYLRYLVCFVIMYFINKTCKLLKLLNQ